MIDLLPRILIVDDLFGRTVAGGRNEERADLCGQLLLDDITGDAAASEAVAQRIHAPVARAVFHRGQWPARAVAGDVVENDLAGTLEVIRRGWHGRAPGTPPWAAVFLDLCFYTGRVTPESDARTSGMPEGRDRDDDPASFFGLTVLDAAHRELPDLPIIILSSKSRQDVSRSFSELGALGFIARGELDTLLTIREYLDRHGLLPDVSGRILGSSISLLLALRSARRAAQIRRHVLIRGEQGSGKELIARYIHESGQDAGAPFVEVDSGTLSPELYASELFGHRRGAFTGAVADRKGRLLQANGGDLFLDEIGNIPSDVQMGLLRVLDSGRVVAVGAENPQTVDVRVLSATNINIEEHARTGVFRSDLLDRLRVGGTIRLPALRERREDIPLLAEKFLQDALRVLPYAHVREITREAVELLVGADWPGNVRELESCVFGAVREHPDVEFLYPAHFKIPSPQDAPLPREAVESGPRGGSLAGSLPDVLRALEAFEAASVSSADLAGALQRGQIAQARFMARLLLAGLRVTARVTPSEPQGRALIHPAIKLLLADSTITASAAADVVKRLLSIAPEAIADLMGEPLLADALASALRLRPRNARPAGAGRPGGGRA